MYLTNKFRNLPLFGQINFYYNDEDKEVTRNIRKSKTDEDKIIITESIYSKTRASELNKKHEYILDRDAKTFLFFVARPVALALSFFLIFCNLMYQFHEVIKINKSITLITFSSCIAILIVCLFVLLYVLVLPYRTTEPNAKLLRAFGYVQHLGYGIMLCLFIYFYFISPVVKSTYIYTCIIHLAMTSFFSFAIYKYIITPLIMLIDGDMKIYRYIKDKKIILIDIKEQR